MSESGQEATPLLLVSMAVARLHGLLIWALSVQLADTCLCCWPDVAKYFSYDAQLLLGGNRDVANRLEQLFLGDNGKCAIYGGRFLDPERLMTEAGQEKQNFSKRLEEVSSTFRKEVCSASCVKTRFRPYEVAECGGCRLLKAPCNDPIVCAGPNILAAVLVPLVILLGAGAGVWYYRRKKTGEEEEEEEPPKTQEDDSAAGSKSSGSSEWSDDTDNSGLSAEKTPDPTGPNVPRPPEANASTWDPIYQNQPGANAPHTPSAWDPIYQNQPGANAPHTPSAWNSTYQNQPGANAPHTPSTWNPTYQNQPSIPSPPHIWSPVYQNQPGANARHTPSTWNSTYQNQPPIPSPPHIWSPS